MDGCSDTLQNKVTWIWAAIYEGWTLSSKQQRQWWALPLFSALFVHPIFLWIGRSLISKEQCVHISVLCYQQNRICYLMLCQLNYLQMSPIITLWKEIIICWKWWLWECDAGSDINGTGHADNMKILVPLQKCFCSDLELSPYWHLVPLHLDTTSTKT